MDDIFRLLLISYSPHEKVDTLNEDQQDIVDFAFAQLTSGDVCYGLVQQVHNFRQQVVAGLKYVFDVELGPPTDETQEDCPPPPAGAPTKQVSRLSIFPAGHFLTVWSAILNFLLLCTGGRNYVLYRLLSISNKFCFQVYCTVYNLTALCTILPHWCLEGGGGMGPETSHVLNH